MLLLLRAGFYAADALSLVYFTETCKLDPVQHPGQPRAAVGWGGFHSEPIQVSDCKQFRRGGIFFYFSFHEHSALGRWRSTGCEVLKDEFCLGRVCAAGSRSSQIAGTTARPPGRLRWRGGEGRTAAQPLALPGNHPGALPWARAFALFGTPPPLPEGVWGDEKWGVRPLMSRHRGVTAKCGTSGRFLFSPGHG